MVACRISQVWTVGICNRDRIGPMKILAKEKRFTEVCLIWGRVDFRP